MNLTSNSPTITIARASKANLHGPVSMDFKGYLSYKMVTSQNVLSEAQVKNFFIS